MVESHIHRVSGIQHKKGLEVGAYWKTEGVVRRMVLRHHRRGSAFCQHVGRTFFPALHVPVLEFEPEFEHHKVSCRQVHLHQGSATRASA